VVRGALRQRMDDTERRVDVPRGAAAADKEPQTPIPPHSGLDLEAPLPSRRARGSWMGLGSTLARAHAVATSRRTRQFAHHDRELEPRGTCRPTAKISPHIAQQATIDEPP
jgi:hypothetical protein